jgi:hypothetical protein
MNGNLSIIYEDNYRIFNKTAFDIIYRSIYISDINLSKSILRNITGEDNENYFGKEKYETMTQDLANKKELKTPKQVEAFFEKHLGKNYDWKPVQKLIDATFT